MGEPTRYSQGDAEYRNAVPPASEEATEMKNTSTMSRLETISKSLATALHHAPANRQRAACLAACEFAIAQTGVGSPAVEQALRMLRSSQPISAELKHALDTLAQRLDEEYFDLQDAAEESDATEDEWKRAFSQARAVSALVFAFGENAFDAASEAVYEATATVDDNQELLAIVSKALA